MDPENIIIQIDDDSNMIPADAAIRIWEQLNETISEDKKETKTKAEPADPKRKKLDTPKMIALRNAGWTYEKIADEMGCSPQTVINHIRKEAE